LTISGQPYERGSDGDECREAFGQLVVSRSDATELFDAGKESLDQIARPSETFASRDEALAAGRAWRNAQQL